MPFVNSVKLRAKFMLMNSLCVRVFTTHVFCVDIIAWLRCSRCFVNQVKIREGSAHACDFVYRAAICL